MYETFSVPDINFSLALNHMLFFRSATSRMHRMLSYNATANAFIDSAKYTAVGSGCISSRTS